MENIIVLRILAKRAWRFNCQRRGRQSPRSLLASPSAGKTRAPKCPFVLGERDGMKQGTFGFQQCACLTLISYIMYVNALAQNRKGILTERRPRYSLHHRPAPHAVLRDQRVGITYFCFLIMFPHFEM